MEIPEKIFKIAGLALLLFCLQWICGAALADEELDFLLGDDEPAVETESADTEPKPADSTATATPAQAQTRAKTSARQPKQKIEEIIVTAQKREENVRDVPIAISVMSGEDLKNAAISSFDEMARLVPNVSFNTDFNSLYMRGVGTAELNVLSEQAVSYVLDGVYVARLDYLKPGFMDVERIEILKGPQGTLYGRNATAGVMSITYGEPTPEWESRASASVGPRDSKRFEGVLSGPVSEDLSFRIAASDFEEDGHTLNRADGTTLGDKDTQQFRAKIHYDITDSLDLSLGYHYFDYFVGVWAGTEVFKYPEPLLPAIQLLDPSFETELNREGSTSRQNDSSGKGKIIPLKLTLDLWDHTFSSITAYSELNDHQGGDIDGSAADFGEIEVFNESSAKSQEFRVVSPPGKLEYIGGVFYYESDFSTDLDIPLILDPGLNTVSGVPTIGPLVQILNPLLGQVLDPASDLLGVGDSADNLNGMASVNVEALGFFGQLTWHVTDTLSLLAGGRYSRDERHGTAVESSDGPLPIWQVLTLGGYSVDKKAVDRNFSPKFSLTWDASDAVTFYGTYAKGFRAGSYNIAALRGPVDFEFRPELSTTLEAGAKTELLDGLVRFNIGVFDTTYEDYQLATFNGFGYSIANAEEVRSKGVESDLTALVYPGLIVTAAVGYNDAEFVKYENGGCPTVFYTDPGGIPPQGIASLPPRLTCDLSGEPLFRAPKWTGNLGANYELPVMDSRMNFIVGANASYKGFEFMDSDLDPVDTQEGYWLYNAQIGLASADGGWSFVIHGKNLGDKLVKTFSGDIPLQAGAHWALTNPPRSVYATAEIRF